MKKAGNFLAAIEDYFLGSNDKFGWENQNKKNGWQSISDYWEYAYWILAFGINIYGATFIR